MGLKIALGCLSVLCVVLLLVLLLGGRDGGGTELSMGAGTKMMSGKLEPTVLVNTGQYIITATEYEQLTDNNCIITIEMENNSNEAVSISAETITANGILLPTSIGCDVGANSSTVAQLYMDFTPLLLEGMETVEDISISFEVMDKNYKRKHLSEPESLDIRFSGKIHSPVIVLDDVLVDEKNLKVELKGLTIEEVEGRNEKLMWLYMRVDNNSDAAISMLDSSVSINGKGVFSSFVGIMDHRGVFYYRGLIQDTTGDEILESIGLNFVMEDFEMSLEEICGTNDLVLHFDSDGNYTGHTGGVDVYYNNRVWKERFA